MLQPRGGSDARADFAEQVAVRLPSSSGGDTSSAGPERRPKAGATTRGVAQRSRASDCVSRFFGRFQMLIISISYVILLKSWKN